MRQKMSDKVKFKWFRGTALLEGVVGTKRKKNKMLFQPFFTSTRNLEPAAFSKRSIYLKNILLWDKTHPHLP